MKESCSLGFPGLTLSHPGSFGDCSPCNLRKASWDARRLGLGKILAWYRCVRYPACPFPWTPERGNYPSGQTRQPRLSGLTGRQWCLRFPFGADSFSRPNHNAAQKQLSRTTGSLKRLSQPLHTRLFYPLYIRLLKKWWLWLYWKQTASPANTIPPAMYPETLCHAPTLKPISPTKSYKDPTS